MSTTLSDACLIVSNPDIAGIGVRTAIYVQALLTLLSLYLAISDGELTAVETRSAAGQTFSIMATACALLVSTIIQASTTEGLDLYHALIILNLSWINNLTFTTLPVAVAILRDLDSDLVFSSRAARTWFGCWRICWWRTGRCRRGAARAGAWYPRDHAPQRV